MRHSLLVLAAAGALVGCASKSSTVSTGTTTAATASTTAADAATPAPTSRNPDIISEEEASTAAKSGVGNAFDLVRRLRPNFLRVNERTSMRGNPTAPLVRLNGQVLGEVAELRGIEIGVIQQIRYYSIVQAENTFSGDRGRPVIAVTTKKLTK